MPAPTITWSSLSRCRSCLHGCASRPGTGARSAYVSEAGLIDVGPLHIDVAAHEATVDGRPLVLTRKEFALLAMLARNEGRVILHRVLLAGVWGDENARVEMLRSHVNQLRRKLNEAGLSNVQIVNEPGVGYRIVVDDADLSAHALSARRHSPTQPAGTPSRTVRP